MVFVYLFSVSTVVAVFVFVAIVVAIVSVPRMPGFRFKHVGHTIQLGHKITKAYYHHDGDSDLGYRGVPFNWGGE